MRKRRSTWVSKGASGTRLARLDYRRSVVDSSKSGHKLSVDSDEEESSHSQMRKTYLCIFYKFSRSP